LFLHSTFGLLLSKESRSKSRVSYGRDVKFKTKNKGDKKMAEKKEITCFLCHKTEHEGILIPCRKGGQDLWVCSRCLPMLIHGG
jgi:hypothetical protein